jgi:hypothetical protein
MSADDRLKAPRGGSISDKAAELSLIVGMKMRVGLVQNQDLRVKEVDVGENLRGLQN